MKKVICCAVLVAIAFLLVGSLSSHAGGSSVHFGVNVGVGHGHWGHGYWGPRYWGPRVWWGPSVWWWGAPYYYSAPPVTAQQPPVYLQPAPPPEEPQPILTRSSR